MYDECIRDEIVGIMGIELSEPEHALESLVIMPGRHDEFIFRRVTRKIFLDLCIIDGIVPTAAVKTPRHHIKAARVDKPSAYFVLPFVAIRSINDHNRTKVSELDDFWERAVLRDWDVVRSEGSHSLQSSPMSL